MASGEQPTIGVKGGGVDGDGVQRPATSVSDAVQHRRPVGLS